MEVTVPAGVASLAASVAGHCSQVLCLGAINVPGLTGGRARGYGLVGVCVDAGNEVDEVASRENENGVHAGVDWAYRGVVGCNVGRREV
jgi:hypothetical protein